MNREEKKLLKDALFLLMKSSTNLEVVEIDDEELKEVTKKISNAWAELFDILYRIFEEEK